MLKIQLNILCIFLEVLFRHKDDGKVLNYTIFLIRNIPSGDDKKSLILLLVCPNRHQRSQCQMDLEIIKNEK